MKDADLMALIAAAEATAEPSLPVEYVERTLALAQRSVRRRRAGSAAAFAIAVAVLAMAVPWLGPSGQLGGSDPQARPSLPAEFADFSAFTSRVADRPAGRAIAVYEYGSNGLLPTWQTLAVGADQDTYRRLDIDNDSAPPVTLSPDGRYVLYFHPSKGTDEFALLDLSTGRESARHSVEWASNVGATITMLAWSPDGRYLAYAVPAATKDATAAGSVDNGDPIRNLAILDIDHDTTVLYPAKRPIYAAAFSLDSRRLAVQSGPDSPIVSVGGQKVGVWQPPSGISPQGNIAWSPDGALMATVLSAQPQPDGAMKSTDARIRFVDMTGSGRTPPPDLPYSTVLGWRSPTSVVVQAWLRDEDTDALINVSILDGSSTVLSRFSRTRSCEYGLERCGAYRIQLATNLIPQAAIRPGDPDLGPWVPIVHIGSAIVVAAVAGSALVLLVLRLRRRRTHVVPN